MPTSNNVFATFVVKVIQVFCGMLILPFDAHAANVEKKLGVVFKIHCWV